MIKVGLISMAHMHGRSYARVIEKLPDAKFVGIYDREQGRAQKYAAEFGVPSFSILDELLAKVDAVLICSENSLHAHYTLAAARAGKHVLCEKPLATNLEDAQEMVRACEEAGVILQTAFPIRFSVPVEEGKRTIDSGAIGKVVAINGTNHGKMPGGWFINKELAGGGAIFDHTVHVVDIMRWYLNSEVKEVYAEVDNALHPEFLIDDMGMIAMEFEDGTIATLDPSWSRPKTFPTWGDVTLKVIGTKGTIEIDAFAQKGESFSDIVGHNKYHFWGDDSNYAMVKDFVSCINEKKKPRADGLDGLLATEVALAAYEAAKEGSVIKLR